jgi:hypothetical protein
MTTSCTRNKAPKAPGSKACVQAPALTQLQVAVPPGYRSGDLLLVDTPSGQRFQVTIPEGAASGGQHFLMNVPQVKMEKQTVPVEKNIENSKTEELQDEQETDKEEETPEEIASKEHATFVSRCVDGDWLRPLAKTRAKPLFCLADSDFYRIDHAGYDNAGYRDFKVYDRQALLCAALAKHGGVLGFTEKRLKRSLRKRKAAAGSKARRQKQRQETLAALPVTDSDIKHEEPCFYLASELEDALSQATEHDWRRRGQIHKIISKPVRVKLGQAVRQALTYLKEGRPTACATVLDSCTEFCEKRGDQIRDHEPVACFDAALPPIAAARQQLQMLLHQSNSSTEPGSTIAP